jgi:hypothetical protein
MKPPWGPTEVAAQPLSRVRVLILDDNPLRALDLEDTIEQSNSAEVFVACDPHEARLRSRSTSRS